LLTVGAIAGCSDNGGARNGESLGLASGLREITSGLLIAITSGLWLCLFRFLLKSSSELQDDSLDDLLRRDLRCFLCFDRDLFLLLRRSSLLLLLLLRLLFFLSLLLSSSTSSCSSFAQTAAEAEFGLPKVMEVTSWGGAGGGHEAQGRTAEDTWGGGRLVGCRVSFGILGGREGWLFG